MKSTGCVSEIHNSNDEMYQYTESKMNIVQKFSILFPNYDTMLKNGYNQKQRHISNKRRTR